MCFFFRKRGEKSEVTFVSLRKEKVFTTKSMENPKKGHSLSFRMTKETKLNIFQFNLIHNILPHKVLLHKMRIVDSASCSDCGGEESLRHLLVSCPSLRAFWSDVFS